MRLGEPKPVDAWRALEGAAVEFALNVDPADMPEVFAQGAADLPSTEKARFRLRSAVLAVVLEGEAQKEAPDRPKGRLVCFGCRGEGHTADACETSWGR